MATKSSTKPAVLEEDVEIENTSEPTTKQIINEGIARVIEATGIDVQKNRYKAMRAIAFQAFAESIDAGDFDRLVDEALANIDELPSGWEIERAEKPAEKPTKAPKAAAEKTTTKKAAATKTAAARPARRRPTR
jgi:hypothetical protein